MSRTTAGLPPGPATRPGSAFATDPEAGAAGLPAASASPDDKAGANLVTPVVRGLRLLRYIAAGGNTSNTSEVGRLIDVNRITVMRLLATLEAEGLIERLPQGGHQVAMGFLTLAATTLGEHDFIGAGRQVAADLSQKLGVSAYLVTPDGLDVVYVVRHLPEAGLVSRIRLGSRIQAYLTAPGRAMLATLDTAALQKLFEGHHFQKETPAGPDSFDTLIAMLTEDRRHACIWSFSGYEAGINACAIAVRDAQGKVIGALSAVGPEHLFTHAPLLKEQVETALLEAAGQLSLIVSADGQERPAIGA